MNRATPIHRTPLRIAAAVVMVLALLALTGGAATADQQLPDVSTELSLDVTKDSWPPEIYEPGRKAAFGIIATNTSAVPVTIVSLTDAVNGGDPVDVTAGRNSVLSTTCEDGVGTVLDPGESYDCSFILFVSGNAGDVFSGVTSVSVEGPDGATGSGQDGETIELLDVHPTIEVVKDSWPGEIYEPGRKAAFGVEMTNTSPEPVTITAVTDAVDGGPVLDVTAGRGPVLSTTCEHAVGTVVAPGDSFACSFILQVNGDPGTVVSDVATVTAIDDEGNTATGADEVSIEILDATPAVAATKSADRASIPEPGADVTYTATVTNTYAEPVEIIAVVDTVADGLPFDVTSIAGPVLATTCDDAVGTVLELDETFACTFTLRVTGNADDRIDGSVAFTVADDEGNHAVVTAGASVDVTDVVPTITVDKQAATESVAIPGGAVEIDVEVAVTNTSVEPVTITGLTDTVDSGNAFDATTATDAVLATTCGEAVGTALTPGQTYRCTFTVLVRSDGTTPVADTVHVTASDDEGNVAVASDDATVEVVAVPVDPDPVPVTTNPPEPQQPRSVPAVQPLARTAPPTTAPAASTPTTAATASTLASTGVDAVHPALVAMLLLVAGTAMTRVARSRSARRL